MLDSQNYLDEAGSKVTGEYNSSDVSASGQILPPYIVYKGEGLMSDTTYGGPLGSRYTNGWMMEHTLDWMRSLFIPSIPNEHPVLLIFDGHSSHLSYEIRLLAVEHNIRLLKLPPHTTHGLESFTTLNTFVK